MFAATTSTSFGGPVRPSASAPSTNLSAPRCRCGLGGLPIPSQLRTLVNDSASLASLRPPFENQHAPARLREAVGDDRTRGAAAHHDRVGLDDVAVQLGVGHAVEPRKALRNLPELLVEPVALRERPVADRAER